MINFFVFFFGCFWSKKCIYAINYTLVSWNYVRGVIAIVILVALYIKFILNELGPLYHPLIKVWTVCWKAKILRIFPLWLPFESPHPSVSWLCPCPLLLPHYPTNCNIMPGWGITARNIIQSWRNISYNICSFEPIMWFQNHLLVF